MSVIINGDTGITTPAETVQGALTTTGNTILGDASTDTLNVGNGGLVKDASGNVGIGTSSPKMKLNAEGTYGNPVTSGATPTGIARFSQTTNNVTLDFGVTTGNKVWMQGADKADLSFTYDIAMQPNGGNLLVGTTSTFSGTSFYQGSSGIYAAYFRQANASSPVGLLVNYSGASPNNTVSAFFEGNDTTTARVVLRSNGGIANYSANNVNLSDRREKTNFAPATSYLDKICAIPVQTFNYIDQNLEEDGGLTLGVVAQDVQAVAPELVMESNWAGKDDEPKMRLSIYQTDLQYALMKCIQEQQAIITQLQADVATLKALSA